MFYIANLFFFSPSRGYVLSRWVCTYKQYTTTYVCVYIYMDDAVRNTKDAPEEKALQMRHVPLDDRKGKKGLGNLFYQENSKLS